MRNNGYSVVGFLAVALDVIVKLGKFSYREQFVGALGLLEEEDVRLCAFQPADH